MNSQVSAIVIVHNQVELLKKCLKSLAWTDETIVVDLDSQEDVASVAKLYKSKYHKMAYVNVVERVRQKTLLLAKNDYVLFVDPDENIPKTLATTIQRIITSQAPSYIKMPRQNYVFGKWIAHAQWWPDYQFRLFKKSLTNWPENLHAQPVIAGQGITLDPKPENAINHINYLSYDQWQEKNGRYAKKQAEELIENQASYTLSDVIKRSVSEITTRYFKYQGYRDGLHGLILSLLQSFYHLQVYIYYWEANKYQSLERETELRSIPRRWFGHGLSEILFWDHDTINLAQKIKSKIIRKLIK